METVGIKELKARLSHYVGTVRAGGEVLVTERGKVVARIIPALVDTPQEVAALYDMARRGLVRLPQGRSSRDLPRPVAVRGAPLADTVLEDRR